ncbi:MAG: hypothetical protein ACXAE3_11590 [Candidatus Kariarchaeaceae archaeon]|jgi:hypothetical protein
MKSRLMFGTLLLVLVSIPFVTANVVILDTSLELFGGEEWSAEVYAERGEMEVFVLSDQDGLNVTMYQNNNTILTMSLIADSPANITLKVNNGEILVFVKTSASFFISSTIQILLIQGDRPVSALLLAPSVLLFLAIPVAYIFGRNQGLQKL